jgi:hypothetical protein
MSALSAKIRKARELRVEAGGFVFTVLRPPRSNARRRSGETPPRAASSRW